MQASDAQALGSILVGILILGIFVSFVFLDTIALRIIALPYLYIKNSLTLAHQWQEGVEYILTVIFMSPINKLRRIFL